MSPQIQRKMTPMYAWIGSPGAKARLSFAGRGHSMAKRRRGPAGEPAVPGEALPWARGSLKVHPKAWAAAMWARGCLYHIKGICSLAMLDNGLSPACESLLPHCGADLVLPCWRTSPLCHKEPLQRSPTLYPKASPPSTLLTVFGQPFPQTSACGTPSPPRACSNVTF